MVIAQLYEYREMIKQSMTKGSLFCKLAHENPIFRTQIQSFNTNLKRLLDATPHLERQELIDAFNALYDGDGNLLNQLFTQVPKLHQFYDAKLDFLCASNETFLRFVESESNREKSSSSSFMAMTVAYDIERDRAKSSLLTNKHPLPRKPKMN